MFIIKNNYYLYIENTRSINLNSFKKNKKISIIYRNNYKSESLEELCKFKRNCNKKDFKFYIANNYRLAINCKSDGLYLSSYNKKLYPKYKINLIGSAHNFREIYEKERQGCSHIILSRLFKTSYKNKSNFLGIVKFNLLTKNYSTNFISLGGINNSNLLKVKIVNCIGLGLLSEIKKKPAISSRLF